MDKKPAYEIERKFLVESLPEGLERCVSHKLCQAYISTNPTIRIRQQDEEYILTVKGGGLMKRVEYELPISREQFLGLMTKIEGNIIEKTRYIIPLKDGLKAELDIYGGDLSGFMNVEVEFPDEKSALLFVPPKWFGREITGDKRFTNGSLSKFGIPNFLQSQ